MDDWDDSFDLVIVGSGGGAMCAALLAARQGRSVVMIEKEARVGGSTARSGGTIWIPANPLMEREGVADSLEEALAYLEATVGDVGPASSPARREAFLRAGPELVAFLEAEGLRFRRCEGYADYYDERAGGKARSRSIEADLLDSGALGEWAGRINRYEGSAFPARCSEFAPLSNAKRTWRGRLTAMRVGWRLLRQRITGRQILGQGAALQGRLLLAVLRHGVPLWYDTPVTDLVTQDGHVVGVEARRGGRTIRIGARAGVLLNAGGFARNEAARKARLPAPQSTAYTLSNPGDTGEMLDRAMALGAATAFLDEAIWGLATIMPGGLPMYHTTDVSKPHCILVDSAAQRFVNEAMSYMEIGQTLYRRHREVPAIPCWAVFDSRHRRNYPWGATPPGMTPTAWIESGYMKRADSLAGLAAQCDLDPAALEATVARFNAMAAAGRDADFGRGDRAYDRYYADPTMSPNPSLGPIETPPFHAVRIWPGDVGTAGGLLTDAQGAVLRADGSRIGGLYATGNITASVMGRAYPGAGASIANSMVFGYLAARHALGVNA